MRKHSLSYEDKHIGFLYINGCREPFVSDREDDPEYKIVEILLVVR